MDAHRGEGATVELQRGNVEQVMRSDWVAAVRGITLVSVSADALVISQKIDQSDVNGVGVAHGGVLYTILDSAAGITANALEPGAQWLTESATIHYQTLAHQGDLLTATCTMISESADVRRFETVLENQRGEVIAVLDSAMERIEEV
ncbi:PaaI family thioesterase [Gulosibacter chungangensis]|uniref:PaaI family thioesterase n=1 Tax=Gulosibacter chungangensis TaxID=979746 RepID=UPI001788158F|nr:PaaI family thioesterase [Gulosibacter chungangensis]